MNIKIDADTLIENKNNYKGTEIAKNLKITGIGQKALKINDSFVKWELIEEVADDLDNNKTTLQDQNKLMRAVIRYMYDVNETVEEETINSKSTFTDVKRIAQINKIDYVNKKVSFIDEENEDNIMILGIGEKAIKYYDGYTEEYVDWEKLEKAYNLIKENKWNFQQCVEHNFSFETRLRHACIIIFILLNATTENSTETSIRNKGYTTKKVVENIVKTTDKTEQECYELLNKENIPVYATKAQKKLCIFENGQVITTKIPRNKQKEAFCLKRNDVTIKLNPYYKNSDVKFLIGLVDGSVTNHKGLNDIEIENTCGDLVKFSLDELNEELKKCNIETL